MKDQTNWKHPRAPRQIDKYHWYYEAKGGLFVVVSSEIGRGHVFTIPWRMVRASLARKDAGLVTLGRMP